VLHGISKEHATTFIEYPSRIGDSGNRMGGMGGGEGKGKGAAVLTGDLFSMSLLTSYRVSIHIGVQHT